MRASASLLIYLLLLSPSAAGPFDDCRAHLPDGPITLTEPAHTTAICYPGYVVVYDNELLVPRWVAYHLTADHTFGCAKRLKRFHVEPNLPPDSRATPTDFVRSGFDKGHQAPAQDFAWNVDRLTDTFSMANIAPQDPRLNQRQWLRLEEAVRAWVMDRKDLIVYIGPMILNHKHTIGRHRVAVPTAFWKVIFDPVTHDTLAFVMPQQAISKGNLKPWQVPISEIEHAAALVLPLPSVVDRHLVPSLWPVHLSIWKRRHREACGD